MGEVDSLILFVRHPSALSILMKEKVQEVIMVLGKCCSESILVVISAWCNIVNIAHSILQEHI